MVTSKPVAINAAFLQEIKEDNVHLRELLAAAADVMDTRARQSIRPAALTDLLQAIRDQLATHFTLEEFLGYVDDAVETAPWLSEKAMQLRGEHELLYGQIAQLADESHLLLVQGVESFPMKDLLVRFQAFCHALNKHEVAEDDLIMQALYDELGVGD